MESGSKPNNGTAFVCFLERAQGRAEACDGLNSVICHLPARPSTGLYIDIFTKLPASTALRAAQGFESLIFVNFRVLPASWNV